MPDRKTNGKRRKGRTPKETRAIGFAGQLDTLLKGEWEGGGEGKKAENN